LFFVSFSKGLKDESMVIFGVKGLDSSLEKL
jgi:hypothetical protein